MHTVFRIFRVVRVDEKKMIFSELKTMSISIPENVPFICTEENCGIIFGSVEGQEIGVGCWWIRQLSESDDADPPNITRKLVFDQWDGTQWIQKHVFQ